MTGIDEIVPFLFSFKTPKRSSKAAPFWSPGSPITVMFPLFCVQGFILLDRIFFHSELFFPFTASQYFLAACSFLFDP